MEAQTIYFTKRFETGLLKGLSVRSQVSFPPSCMAHYARNFATGTKGEDCITRARWTITDASFQSYAR